MKTPDIHITPEILRLVAEIDEFKGRWYSLGQLLPARLKLISKIAQAESTGASLRLDGISCTDRQVGEIIAGHTLTDNTISHEQMDAIQGYLKILNLIQKSYNKISLVEKHIKQLHGIICPNEGPGGNSPGEYKQTIQGGNGTATPGFAVVAPDRLTISVKMRELVQWVNEQLGERKLHPLLAIIIFIKEFNAIRPFAIGNGRMRRILLTLLLTRSGYTYIPYYSLDHLIELSRKKYLALVRTPSQDETDYLGEWLTFYLRILRDMQDRLLIKIEREKEIITLPDSSKKIIEIVKEFSEATISQIQKDTGINRNTLKIRLRKLVAENFLIQKGKGKGTRYTVAA